jgi:hypothetical protein
MIPSVTYNSIEEWFVAGAGFLSFLGIAAWQSLAEFMLFFKL